MPAIGYNPALLSANSSLSHILSHVGAESRREFESNHLILAQFNDRSFYFTRTEKRSNVKLSTRETANTSTSVCLQGPAPVQSLAPLPFLHSCLAVGSEHLGCTDFLLPSA